MDLPVHSADQGSVYEACQRRGISRRRFLQFCSAITATLALPSGYAKVVAAALTEKRKPTVVWLEYQDCAGCTESMLRSAHPTIEDIVLEAINLEYHETIMAGAGAAAESVLQKVVKNEKGKYLVIVEGAIPTADGGVYCTIGGRTALDLAREVCGNAAGVIAVGACAWDGGLVRSHPDPTGALGVQEALPELNVINLAGCPHNVANTTAVLVHYLTFGEMPALDQYNRPLFAYGQIVHDQCQRRAHYDAGRFVEAWGDEGHRQGWCLYKMGCKGPEATFNCPVVQWNSGTSWPVRAGHGCIACASPRFWDTASPFYERLPHPPGFGVDVTAGDIGWSIVGGVAALSAAHGVGRVVRDHLHPHKEETPPYEVRGCQEEDKQ
ncbi:MULTISPECIES: hydrogenase small subunit [Acidobacterium]|uniref:Nickel-dependent hydrogenase, small subunit n=1 Tax=Acidobacterium capsulatum (strain ATCC 51196 / DSM 11244 / BCRC 80197 / JCM 7670 / NBRC 15755 / NCIMB 13165 / 161) TaxID=240015 RepID=C1F4K9_ACIC5|nr:MULTISPECIES: hydrogenase small subunit [Acidobacterium]ACO32416.1 nickel-dependent hydrogenase, small subunit [Acidobacterium capsulatum ATCC 51196]HCT61825.1 [Ni/Fe] hydrogenase small subunit [Acidobacterium sp.]